ncbi:class I SAM-dependent methyltransferase [Actinoplanes aureus]|uniref:Class I SAM-dependent methyltransferase n=1 Tax=Actinoplanes aureus TaxID=2792083 RepID=A0A931C9N4_9ACTN|nr:class I SAM-dependent methyltransferase [Actinoplanes aureus]MBG0562601.1 class I SAM-dependent methyltransferase [Actinoplanes aureus]
MRDFQGLIEEATTADVSGWDFGWLDGRATEERPPWGYARQLADRLPRAEAALDLDTGGGEIIAGVPELPSRMVVTEGWQPNVERARRLLEPRGVEVVPVEQGAPLPFADGAFDLVSSRHPVAPAWGEIARVLRSGGTYFAQHVGPASAYELIEFFLGPLPREDLDRDPHREAAAARAAGLEVVALRTVRCRMELFDVGAVVYLLRKCVWWVPGFSVERYRDRLAELDARIREHGPFVAHSSRTLFEAVKG